MSQDGEADDHKYNDGSEEEEEEEESDTESQYDQPATLWLKGSSVSFQKGGGRERQEPTWGLVLLPLYLYDSPVGEGCLKRQ